MISIAELKDYLKITITDLDDFLQTCIDAAIGIFETHTNRKLKDTDYIDYSYGNDTDSIFLKATPIGDITAVEKYDGTDSYDDIFTAPDTAANSIIAFDESIRLLKGYTFAKNSHYKISYSAGYSDVTCPPEIKQELKEIASLIFFDSPQGKARLGLSSQNIGGASAEGISFKDINFAERPIIQQYRRINV